LGRSCLKKAKVELKDVAEAKTMLEKYNTMILGCGRHPQG
jgi:hypothetical protein